MLHPRAHYTFADHLATAQIQTNSSGVIIYQAEYEPYGRVFALRSGDLHQPLRFPGQVAEQFDIGANGATERAYNVSRWYRASWGRYSQPDPLGLAREIQLFAYSGDGPIQAVDPLGLCADQNPLQHYFDSLPPCASAIARLRMFTGLASSDVGSLMNPFDNPPGVPNIPQKGVPGYPAPPPLTPQNPITNIVGTINDWSNVLGAGIKLTLAPGTYRALWDNYVQNCRSHFRNDPLSDADTTPNYIGDGASYFWDNLPDLGAGGDPNFSPN